MTENIVDYQHVSRRTRAQRTIRSRRSRSFRVVAALIGVVFLWQTTGASAHVLLSAQWAASINARLRQAEPIKRSQELMWTRSARVSLVSAVAALRGAANLGSLSPESDEVIERHLRKAEEHFSTYLAALRARGDKRVDALERRAVEQLSALRSSIDRSMPRAAQANSKQRTAALLSAAAELEASFSAPAPPQPTSPMPLSMRPRVVSSSTSSTRSVEDLAPAQINSASLLSLPLGPPSGLPEPADLADAVDAEQCPAVVQQASLLAGDPLAIYEFVRHNIDYEPYYGLRKGSCATLLARNGNSLDQASLLIAMLRSSGVAARFATATVEIPAVQAAGMMGLSDPALASSMIQTSAIPAVSIVEPGGSVVAVRMERGYVEAYVPYANYRGVPNSDTGATWIALDPAFKQFIVTPPIDVNAATGLDIATFNATLAAASTIDPIAGQVVGVDSTVLESEVNALGANLNTTLDAMFGVDAATASDVLGSKVVVEQLLGALPASLPYTLVSKLTEGATLSASLRYMFTLQVGSAVYSAPMAVLADHSLTVAYPAVSGSPDPDSIFACIPTIRLDGVPVATGSQIDTGSPVTVILTYVAPNQSNEQISTTREAGEVLAIVLDLGRMSRESMLAASDAMVAAVGSLERSEWALTLQGRTYFAELDSNIEVAAVFSKIRFLHEVFGAIVSEVRNTEFLFSLPVGTTYAGMNIDVARQLLTPFSTVGDADSPRTFLLSMGINSSAMEHSVFNHLLDLAAVSTAQIFDLANSVGVPIYRIDSSNQGTIVPLLNQSASIISTVNSEVAAGRVVTIPRDPVSYFDWDGTGFITEDPGSGAAGYIISGGLAGSVSITSGGDLAEFLACIGAIVQLVDLLPIPGATGVVFDVLALPSGLYDVFRADVAPWRKSLARVFVFISLLGILSAIPTPATIIIGVLADVISYLAVWALLGGGNPLNPCIPSLTRMRIRPAKVWV